MQLTVSDQPIEKMSNTIESQNVDKTNQNQAEEIRIETIQQEDTEEVLAMLKEFFFKVSVSVQTVAVVIFKVCLHLILFVVSDCSVQMSITRSR